MPQLNSLPLSSIRFSGPHYGIMTKYQDFVLHAGQAQRVVLHQDETIVALNNAKKSDYLPDLLNCKWGKAFLELFNEL